MSNHARHIKCSLLHKHIPHIMHNAAYTIHMLFLSGIGYTNAYRFGNGSNGGDWRKVCKIIKMSGVHLSADQAMWKGMTTFQTDIYETNGRIETEGGFQPLSFFGILKKRKWSNRYLYKFVWIGNQLCVESFLRTITATMAKPRRLLAYVLSFKIGWRRTGMHFYFKIFDGLSHKFKSIWIWVYLIFNSNSVVFLSRRPGDNAVVLEMSAARAIHK